MVGKIQILTAEESGLIFIHIFINSLGYLLGLMNSSKMITRSNEVSKARKTSLWLNQCIGRDLVRWFLRW